jgi:hypothetical protein
MTELLDKLIEYTADYTQNKIYELEKKALKNTIYPHYQAQQEKVFKTNNLLMKKATREARAFTPDIYELLEDHGLLPLAVSLSKSLGNLFNLDRAKTNLGENLRLYAGGVSFLDKEDIMDEFESKYSSLDLKELTDLFNVNHTSTKLAETKLELKKKELMDIMKKEKVGEIKTELGTLRIEQTYDLDINFIFDALSGRKELFLKDTGFGSYEILILPDNKKATLPATFKFFGEKTLTDFSKETQLSTSKFIKKGVYNKLVRSGYIGFDFEVEVNPMEYFKQCKVSFEKVETLVEEGLLEAIEVEKCIIKVPEKNVEYFEVVTEASAEKRKEIFDKKLLKKSKQFDFLPISSNPFDNIELESFSF